jgi:hypothetical protein
MLKNARFEKKLRLKTEMSGEMVGSRLGERTPMIPVAPLGMAIQCLHHFVPSHARLQRHRF